MKIIESVVLALAVVFLVVGIDLMLKGHEGYWALMFSLGFLFGLNLLKMSKKTLSSPTQIPANTPNKKTAPVRKKQNKAGNA